MRVVDASPLIVLSRLSRIELLREPRPDVEIVVPQAVLDEVMRGKSDDPAPSMVHAALGDWLGVIPTPPVHASIQVRGLGRGEIAEGKAKMIRWAGVMPPQKRTTFYMKVVSPFASAPGLSLSVEVEVPADEDDKQAKAQLEKIRNTLKDLGLEDSVKMSCFSKGPEKSGLAQAETRRTDVSQGSTPSHSEARYRIEA